MENQSKSLAIKNTYFSPEVWEQMKNMSEVFIQSKALPSNIQNAAQAIMIMQAGYEMGMKPLEAIKSLYIVNGQINIWGSATIRRLREHGWKVEYRNNVTSDDSSVTAIVKKDKQKYEQLASFKAAERSGYTKDRNGMEKVGWRSGINRQLKLRYLAVSMLIKSYIPEVLGSVNDIQEVAEDFVLPEEVDHEGVKHKETVLLATPEQRATSLKSFLESDYKEVENKFKEERSELEGKEESNNE